MRLARLSLFALVSMLGACATQHPDRVANEALGSGTTSPLPSVLALPAYPLGLDARPTTSGDQALAHLQGDIERRERRWLEVASKQCQDADCDQRVAGLAGAVFQRFQWLGDLSDLDRTVRLLEQLSATPDHDALWLQANVSAYIHDFDVAEAALASLPESSRTRVKRSEFRYARELAAHDRPTDALTAGEEFDHLIDLAYQCIDSGDLECASKHFHAAQFVYHDSAPMPLAWLHTQQGIALLRFGYPEQAIPFFRAAVARAPGFVLAAEHLAECLMLSGELQESLAIYRKVVAQTGNPEFLAAMAEVQRKQGDDDGAERSIAEARASFDQWLVRFPNAFTMHAVGFYLEHGEAKRGLQLARNNLGLRQDAASHLLLAEAAIANGDNQQACGSLKAIAAAGLAPPELSELGAKVQGCDLR